MKCKKWLVRLCCLLLLPVLAGCGGQTDRGNDYQDTVASLLASFTQEEGNLCLCLESIAASDAAPTPAQLDEAERDLTALSAVCDEIIALDAPFPYGGRQKSLRGAMEQTKDAMARGQALVDFYCGYDEAFRAYADVEEGSREMREKALTLYTAFAEAVRQATASLHEAQKKW